MEKIDLDTFSSASTRIQDERVPVMEADLASRMDVHRQYASGLTKQQIMDELDLDAANYVKRHQLTGKEAKPELVEHFAQALRELTDDHDAINTMKTAARADVRMAEQVNDLIDKGEGKRRELAELLAKPGSSVGRILQWKGDDAAVAGAAADYAAKVADAVQRGVDIYDTTRATMYDAVQELVGFPRMAKVNGASGATKADHLWSVLGAQNFLNAVQSSYGIGRHPHPMTLDVTYLR